MNDFISYGKQWIDDDDVNFVVDTLKSDFLTQGPRVEEFEKKLCEYTKAKYCVVVSSGTAALHLAVKVLEIEKGKEGITTPITFVSSSNCLLHNELKPVFADIDKNTYNIDKNEIEKKINTNTKVIIPVHFAGQTCDMKEIHRMAVEKGLYVIEDAAHAIGSRYEDGMNVGNCKYSDMTIFSFHPVKTITSGEGGAIMTNNKEFYEKLLMLRTIGITKKPELMSKYDGPWYYEMKMLGYHFRLNDIQCALGISQLKKLVFFVERRREIVQKYNKSFKEIENITIPYEKDVGNSAFHLYVLKFDFDKIGTTRSNVMEYLKGKNIGTQVHYIPVHTQPYYQDKFGYKWGDYPEAENYYIKTLSIPLYPKMTDDDINYVIKTVSEVVRK
jgi:UDP-4-amino-4,6-dideoxy-N-acetyl-beta-L-altrosamine transaminase